jgi:hypothetical protein
LIFPRKQQPIYSVLGETFPEMGNAEEGGDGEGRREGGGERGKKRDGGGGEREKEREEWGTRRGRRGGTRR